MGILEEMGAGIKVGFVRAKIFTFTQPWCRSFGILSLS
jgi:hypothetical protein